MPEVFRSLKGQLLLDSGQLRGSPFHRSVVLICQHDPEGAFGVVLNQPTTNKIGDVIVSDLPESLKEEILYMGGPVQTDALTYLHSDTFLAEANIIPNLSMGHSLEELQEIAGGFSPAKRIRCYAGYAGWSAGQLESEMKRKAWLLHPADIELVFSAKTAELWSTILRGKSWKHRLLADSPEDLSRN
jgi:putative transcriptional regulator